ncbi:MAG: rubredoxin [Chitinophagaceae bacterium]
MKSAFQFKINCKGGIISPGYLLNLLELLEESGIENIRFGLRQQILIDASSKQYSTLTKILTNKKIDFEINKEEHPNIVSSYAAEDIFVHENWLKEGIYKDVLDAIEYTPSLKINISDNNQCFTPFFSGHINWIASEKNHFWYLCIRFPKTNVLFHWPQILYTNEVATLTQTIEQLILQHNSKFLKNEQSFGEWIFQEVTAQKKYIAQPIENALQLPVFNLPYYEGFNSYGNKTWLGIYRRDELFPIKFLKEIAITCLQTKIGQLYTTPWKSLIVKNIERKDRIYWDAILGKYRINVRHAANELNWQIEDHIDEGLQIKRHIIREFDKQDVRTYGLCFAVKTQAQSELYGSVLIQKNNGTNKGKQPDNFDIYYTENFNPNSKNYILYRQFVGKEYVHTYLISLCKYFYEVMYSNTEISKNASQFFVSNDTNNKAEEFIYQCKDCYTVYDEKYGEPDQEITAGTNFQNLPDTFYCPTCEAPKSNFLSVIKEKLISKEVL